MYLALIQSTFIRNIIWKRARWRLRKIIELIFLTQHWQFWFKIKQWSDILNLIVCSASHQKIFTFFSILKPVKPTNLLELFSKHANDKFFSSKLVKPVPNIVSFDECDQRNKWIQYHFLDETNIPSSRIHLSISYFASLKRDLGKSSMLYSPTLSFPLNVS